MCAELCSTCVFRPGNLMRLKAGRVREMVDEAKRHDSAIVCHKTLDTGADLVCRGFYDRHWRDVFPLRLAVMVNAIIFDPPPLNQERPMTKTRAKSPGALGLVRIQRGLYRHSESGWYILRSEGIYEGPRGGKRDGWEFAYWRDREGFTIDSAFVSPTLEHAVEGIGQQQPYPGETVDWRRLNNGR